MTIFWNLDPAQLARITGARGEPSAYALAKLAGISQPAAAPIVHGGPVDRVDTGTLEAVARAFDVEDPFTLLRYAPDEG